MDRAAVVTGASTGIGYSACKVLIAHGWRVFGSVRTAADAARLAVDFGSRFTPLAFDVTDAAAVHAAAAQVRTALGGERLAGLVNNAGIAVAGPLLYLDAQEFRHQLDVNLAGVVIATQAFAPLLGTDPESRGPPGRILNIGSVGGKVAFPFMAPYHATKFGLEGLSESLRRELLIFGIGVVLVAPGGIRTPIWDKAEAIDIGPYRDTVYAEPLERIRRIMIDSGRTGLPADRVGEAIHRILIARRPRLRYTIAPNPIVSAIMRFMPKRWFDQIVGRQLKLLPIRDEARRSD